MFEYHRENNRRPIGVLTAVIISNDVRFGWSLCSKLDKFDKDFGLQLAEARAIKYKPNEIMYRAKLPNSMEKHLVEFSKRAQKYFKDKEVFEF